MTIMINVKFFLRRLILFFLYLFSKFYGLFHKRKEPVILMYHSVSDSDWFFAVLPAEFEKQMRYLKEKYNLVRLKDVADFIGGKIDLPAGSVAVTFDDGYKDFLINALPILKKYRIPATLFVCAGEVDRKELGNEYELLNLGEIKNIAETGLVDIGSHGITHRKLTRISMPETENEIKNSRVIIKEKTGFAPDFFSYPKGSFSSEITEKIKKAGYKGGVSALPIWQEVSLWSMPRRQIDKTVSFFEFKLKLTKAAEWYYKLWRIQLYI